MATQDYNSLRAHIGHKVVVVCYHAPEDSDPENVAIECEDCGVVLVDYDNEVEPEGDQP